MNPWIVTDKGDDAGRALADKHYTRQTIGAAMWTRPGFNYVLRTTAGDAVFVWWRPKWEDGRPGTERKDRLRVIECAIFRREETAPLASDLVVAAVVALRWAEAHEELRYATMGPVEWLITGIGAKATAARRSKQHPPGYCYLKAGWEPFDKRGGARRCLAPHAVPGTHAAHVGGP